MATTKDDPAAVDQYLAGLPADRRATLEELRQLIRATVPGVQQRISYGTAVIFALKRDLVGFVAQPNHLSFLIMSPDLAKAMEDEIRQTHRVSGPFTSRPTTHCRDPLLSASCTLESRNKKGKVPHDSTPRLSGP